MQEEDLMQHLAVPPSRHLAPLAATSTVPAHPLRSNQTSGSTSTPTRDSLLRIANTLMEAAGMAFRCGDVPDVIHGCAVELRNLATAELGDCRAASLPSCRRSRRMPLGWIRAVGRLGPCNSRPNGAPSSLGFGPAAASADPLAAEAELTSTGAAIVAPATALVSG